MSIFISSFAGGVREMTRLGRLAHLHGNHIASLHCLTPALFLPVAHPPLSLSSLFSQCATTRAAFASHHPSHRPWPPHFLFPGSTSLHAAASSPLKKEKHLPLPRRGIEPSFPLWTSGSVIVESIRKEATSQLWDTVWMLFVSLLLRSQTQLRFKQNLQFKYICIYIGGCGGYGCGSKGVSPSFTFHLF